MISENYHLAAILLMVAGIYKALDPYPGEIMGALMEQYIISPTGYRIITLVQPWFEIGLGLFALFLFFFNAKHQCWTLSRFIQPIWL